MMRKYFKALSIAALAAAALATPALAQQDDRYPVNVTTAEVATGAVAGTAVGVGLYNGWWGTSAAGVALPSSLAASAAVGGVVGVGAVAAIDGVVQPCRGVQALLGVNHGACANGEYVGYAPARRMR
jgi:hypothetical protein